MKFTIAFAGIIVLSSFSIWGNNFEKAREQATSEHKNILLNFSGSDWCGPCIRMRHEIFENVAFIAFADKNLVLVNADFPRQKKNQLSNEQQQQNDRLADKYNSTGSFPLTVLLNEQGKVIKQWEGYPKMSPEEFTETVKQAANAVK
ncbi:MAG: thioredoxin family protein [Sediminibacterium sp.]